MILVPSWQLAFLALALMSFIGWLCTLIADRQDRRAAEQAMFDRLNQSRLSRSRNWN